MRRFSLEKYTPFAKAMHIDADCLLIGNNINKFWELFHELPFGVMANLQTTGKCYRDQIDVDAIREHEIAQGVYITNWGVFSFDNSGNNSVMARARDLLELQVSGRTKTALSYFSRAGEYSDEPFWGIALAQLEIKLPELDYGDLLQLTSPNTSEHIFDYERGYFSAKKGGISNATGQIFHFAAMNPLDHYLNGIKFYRESLNIPLPAIVCADGTELAPADWSQNVSTASQKMKRDGKSMFKFKSYAG